MSVINKMLRDLDQRDGAVQSAPPQAVRMDTAPLPKLRMPDAGKRKLPWGMVLLVAAPVLLAIGYWWWQKAPAATPVPAPVAWAPATPAPVTLPAPGTVPVADVPVEKPTPLNTKPVAAKTNTPAVQPAAPVQTPAPVLKSAAVAPATPAVAIATAPAPVTAVAAAAPAEPATGSTRQLQAGRDALAQAQTLWSAGSHDAAADLLQGAMGVIERSASTAPSVAQTQLLAALARELGRMHLAEGRPAAALDALTRVEPQLGREADIWAMRGNAAQRLGKHQDSVNAYATALQLRPNEQRWLLGSAVSLAALGQTANATEMADKARAIGPISKEVQAYLRQAGVRVSEP